MNVERNLFCKTILTALVLSISSFLVLGKDIDLKGKVHSQYIPHKGDAEDIMVIKSPLPHTYLKDKDLPQNFDWSKPDLPKYANRNCVTTSFNQNHPMACGSCWAFATTGALSDRFKIATDCLLPDINLSPQVLLDCGQEMNNAGSCLGGSHLLAYSFINQYGITDTTCNSYKAADITSWAEISCSDRMCRDCDVEGVCQFVNGTKYYADEFGQIQGEEQMKAEIYARGPIACLLYAHSPEFWAYDGKSIISDPQEYPGITHVVSIQGWGVEESTGEEFWVGRNTFGTRWGAQGFFKILRGKNTLNLESNPCVWAVPAASSVEDYKGNFF